MSQQRAFTDIPLPTRSEKPRNTGLTMMIDWGLPLGQQKDVLESASDYIDMAKVAATIPALLPEEVLKKKHLLRLSKT